MERCWFRSAQFQSDYVNWHAGCVIGLGLSGIDTIAERVIPYIDSGKVKD